MLNFYNDRKQTFECKLKLEGTDTDLKKSNIRLVFEDGNVQRFYEGKADVLGNCVFELPPLKEMKNTRGDVVLEVRVNDVVFEPYRNKYNIKGSMKVVGEATVSDKMRLVKVNAPMKDLKLVREMLKGFDRVDDKNKKVLREYINLKYEPGAKVKEWAGKVFNDLDNIKAKIVMYEIEEVFNKK